MRQCPTCGSQIEADSCSRCGWKDNTSAAPVEVLRDPNWWRCAHTELGARCGRAGSVSRDTSGPAGESKWQRTWFCYDHAFPKHAPPRSLVTEGYKPDPWKQVRELLPLGERE